MKPTIYSKELQLRNFLRNNLSPTTTLSFVEPAISSTLGLPDVTVSSPFFATSYIELKLATLNLKTEFFSYKVRPNQKKQLRRLSLSSPCCIVFAQINTDRIFATKISEQSISGKLPFSSAHPVFSLEDILSFLSDK